MIKYIIRSPETDKYDPNDLGKKLLTTWDTCPCCKLRNHDTMEKAYKANITQYKVGIHQKWIFGLFRKTTVSMEGQCARCGSKWYESKYVPGSLKWCPLKHCAVQIIAATVCLVLSIPFIKYFVQCIVTPSFFRETSTGKFTVMCCGLMALLVFAGGMIAMAATITYNKNHYN